METRIYQGCKRLYQIDKVKDLKEMLQRTQKLYQNNVAFRFKTETPEVFETKTYGEYIEEINALGTALISLG